MQHRTSRRLKLLTNGWQGDSKVCLFHCRHGKLSGNVGVVVCANVVRRGQFRCRNHEEAVSGVELLVVSVDLNGEQNCERVTINILLLLVTRCKREVKCFYLI